MVKDFNPPFLFVSCQEISFDFDSDGVNKSVIDANHPYSQNAGKTIYGSRLLGVDPRFLAFLVREKINV